MLRAISYSKIYGCKIPRCFLDLNKCTPHYKRRARYGWQRKKARYTVNRLRPTSLPVIRNLLQRLEIINIKLVAKDADREHVRTKLGLNSGLARAGMAACFIEEMKRGCLLGPPRAAESCSDPTSPQIFSIVIWRIICWSSIMQKLSINEICGLTAFGLYVGW